MRRSEASPEADTASYCPVFIRVTISSDVPAILVLTLQPVAFSNGWTQSTVLSFEPSSAYPAQATRLTWPSPAPRVCIADSFGGVKPASVPPPPLDVLLLSPQPAANSETAAIATSARRVDRMGTPIRWGVHMRGFP